MVLIINNIYHFPSDVYSTICVTLTTLAGFMLIIKISRPFNLLRGTLLVTLVGIFVACYAILRDLFVVTLPQEYIGITIILGIIAIFIFIALNLISNKILKKQEGKNK